MSQEVAMENEEAGRMEKTAAVTYFYHSGFTVEVLDTLLVFDYWRGEHGELSEKAQLQERDLEGYKRVLVFVSHDHEDHFDGIIYSWDYQRLPITYVISDDLPPGKRGKRVKPGDILTVGDVEIRVFSSTDKGVSFYVSLYGLHIYGKERNGSETSHCSAYDTYHAVRYGGRGSICSGRAGGGLYTPACAGRG